MAKAKQSAATDAATAAQETTPQAGHKFELGKAKYQYTVAKFSLAGVGVRTALEASTDDTKYESLGNQTINEYLVGIGSGVVAEI